MHLFEHHFRAMGTQVGLWLWHEQPHAAHEALAHVETMFRTIEAQLSRFRPDSELSRLNSSMGEPLPVSSLLFAMTEQALTWREQTGGLFDPTMLPALEAAGYDRSFEQLSPAMIVLPPPAPASASITLDAATQTITLPLGVGLDFGGIAKGWTVQQAAKFLKWYGPALVDAGGDIFCTAPPPYDPAWTVGVAHPQDEAESLGILFLSDEAVATSSLKRNWLTGETRRHHLIDPRTGDSAATDLYSVTVVAPRLPDAEIHAKVALILGETDGLTYLETLPEVAALLLTADGRLRTVGPIKEKSYVYANQLFSPVL